jgi:ADP-ribosylglycohydrolase
MENKIRGCIWGAIVGDALGTRYEFISREDARLLLEKDSFNSGLNILGEGPFNLVAGQFTDDSELMVSLLNSIVENNGQYNPNNVAEYYINWLLSNPFNVDRTTSNALTRAFNYQSIINNSHITNQKNRSNGCLMRCMSLGIISILNTKNTHELAKLDTPLTNPDKDCVNAVEIYNIIVCFTILGMLKDEILTKIKNIATPTNLAIIKKSAETPVFYKDGEPVPADGPMCGLYAISLQNALYHFFKNTPFEKAMIDTISMGGDVDTNCCILGGLLGVSDGYESIPKRWQDTVSSVLNPSYDRFNKLPYLQPSKIDETIDRLIDLLTNKL